MKQSSILLAITALLGLLLGLLLGRWPQRQDVARRDSSAGPAAAGSVNESLEAQLSRLEAALGDLVRALEAMPRSAAGSPSERTPVHEVSNPGLARVTRSLEDVADLLSRMATNRPPGATSPSSGQPLVPVWVDRKVAFDRLDIRGAAGSDDDQAWEKAHRDLQLRHLFWSAQQVLDVYGVPDEISSNGGTIDWSYRLERGGDETEYLSFQFVQGAVSQVDYDN